MSEQQQKKLPRWKKGGQRYGREDMPGLKKLRSQREPGWRNGARVNRRPFASSDRLDFLAQRKAA